MKYLLFHTNTIHAKKYVDDMNKGYESLCQNISFHMIYLILFSWNFSKYWMKWIWIWDVILCTCEKKKAEFEASGWYIQIRHQFLSKSNFVAQLMSRGILFILQNNLIMLQTNHTYVRNARLITNLCLINLFISKIIFGLEFYRHYLIDLNLVSNIPIKLHTSYFLWINY